MFRKTAKQQLWEAFLAFLVLTAVVAFICIPIVKWICIVAMCLVCRPK